jgi:hypothetical protein
VRILRGAPLLSAEHDARPRHSPAEGRRRWMACELLYWYRRMPSHGWISDNRVHSRRRGTSALVSRGGKVIRRARGDWLRQRGDAIEGITGRWMSRSNRSAPSFEKDLAVLADGYRACGASGDRQRVERRRQPTSGHRPSRGCPPMAPSASRLVHKPRPQPRPE